MTTHTTANKDDQNSTDIKQIVLQAIDAIQFGSVEVIIHDGQIMQIESREKTRIDRFGSVCKRK